MDGAEKLTEIKLPPKSAFFNRLDESESSDADYEHAQTVCRSLGMRMMNAYLEAYVKSDLLLLAYFSTNHDK